VPRSVRRLKRDLDQTLTELRHQLGREPAATEIAASLGVSVDAYDGMLDELCVAGLAMADRTWSDRDPDELLGLSVDHDDGPYAQLERRELRAQLARALADLPDRERQILALSYQEELTLAEIGQVIGVGESRVSQLRTQAIARLRSRLREWLKASRAA